MMRAGTSAILSGLLGLFAGLVIMALPASAQTQSTATHVKTSGHGLTADEFSAQSREVVRRTPRRVRIYRGSSYPGPNSKRVCNAYYEQEYRPSGTVIVPRMNCYWSG
ncbi:MAG: hypothetical protein U0987_10575 [Afipia sp.]|nr:hypothetical protein [Afipia sp.]